MKTFKKGKKQIHKKGKPAKGLISYRKSCNVSGTGLSHYILKSN
ncbi:MAG: modified peptide precursor CbpA [Deltaproteobacteria bacterium]|nr:modified peptide precursor CbpA [Deltaproteobacteria bacterium]